MTDRRENPLHVVILAAGEGKRMKSDLPKVLQPVGGLPMLLHVLDTAEQLDPAAVHVVHGVGADAVRAACQARDLVWVYQEQRLGTGHAVMQAIPAIPDNARVLVLNGDHPLVPAEALHTLLETDERNLAFLTMTPDDPAGYGRVLRDNTGAVIAVVEHRDATPDQRSIGEVNSGVILAPADRLRNWLERIGNDNDQGEFYLTDAIDLAAQDGDSVVGISVPDASVMEGANDRMQLAALEAQYRRRACLGLMSDGVHIADPDRCDVRGTVSAGRDVFLDVNVVLQGSNALGDGVSIAPGCVLTDCDLAAGTRVHAYSVLEGVKTTGPCDIGPFARVRPGTQLAAGSRIGNFVEVKNSSLGEDSKASHLTYLGDAEIGDRVNIGAGTITCNYDGVNKHRTVIGDGAFIGSDSQLVAPVTVGENATLGAGTTLSHDAPADHLTVSRARQTTVRGWKRPSKKQEES